MTLRLCILIMLIGSQTNAREILYPGEYDYLGDAIASAAYGDTVTILAGVHVTGMLPLPSGVLVRGATGDPADVVLDPGMAEVFYVIGPCCNAVVKDTTLYHGHSAVGSGFYCDSADDVLIENCVFRQCESYFGGAICVTSRQSPSISTNLTIKSCTFEECFADELGGVICIGNYTNVRIVDSTFRNNTLRWGRGGAVNAGTRSRVVIEGCSFLDNDVEHGNGGAIGAWPYADVKVIGCFFQGNHADDGGAISARTIDIDDCIFENNAATGDGGALHVLATETVENLTFIDNSAARGGAVWSLKALALRDCRFDGNTAPVGPDGYADSVILSCTSSDPAAWAAHSITLDNEGCEVPSETMSFSRLKSLYR